MSESKPDLVIRPKRGVRAPRYGRGRLVVELSVWEPGHERYDHPLLRFRIVDAEGTPLYGDDVEIRFQRHGKGRSDLFNSPLNDSSDPLHYLGGFMALRRGVWSYCYAAELRSKLEYRAPFARRVIDIYERAREAAREGAPAALHRSHCELMLLVRGLRRIGVEIRIWSDPLRRKRAWRVQAAVAA
jgi:hypothetical protein